MADRLHLDPRSVRRAIARGELPASRACGLPSSRSTPRHARICPGRNPPPRWQVAD